MIYIYPSCPGVDIPKLWSLVSHQVSSTLISIREDSGSISLEFLQTLNEAELTALITITNNLPIGDSCRTLSKLQFRVRFTFEERIALDSSTDPAVHTLRRDFFSAEFIDLDDPLTIGGLDLLVYKNIILNTRKAEILA